MPLVTIASATINGTPSPSNFEQQVTFTVTITASAFNTAPPSGSINFFDNNNPIGSASLTPLTPTSTVASTTFNITILTVGIHNITINYAGDSNYDGFSTTFATPSPFVQQINSVASAAPVIIGFAMVASYTASGDSSLPPQATVYAVPNPANPSQSVTLLWDTINVGQIEITGNNGVDYQPHGFDTGRISTTGSGVYVVGNGFTKTILLTLTAYDSTGHPLGLTSTVELTIT